jgi:dUTP pyrophosphatase
MSGRIGISLRWLEHGRGLPVPAAQSDGAAGMDIAAALALGERLVIAPGKRAMVPAGFAMALPPGCEAQIRPRSGLAAKHGVTVLNSPGTIDADYRGEVKVVLINHGDADFVVQRGDRIAQMVIAPVTPAGFTEVEVLDDTARGEGGYGSTGAR